MKYYKTYHRNINLKKPLLFSEKLQWIKMHDHNPLYTVMVDKVDAKDYVAEKIGKEHIIPTIKVWGKAEEIDFDILPEEFVIKATHDSGRVVVCKDKKSLDCDKVRKDMEISLKRNFYNITREWPYKNVKPRIIAEQYIDQPGGLVDYKFYCFNGYVDCVMACLDRASGKPKFYFFDKDWKLMPLNQRSIDAPADFHVDKPKNLDRMFEIASILSKGIPFVRVDLYNVEGKIYFGELTFFPAGGNDPNRLPSSDKRWGDLMDLNLVKKRN